MISNKKIALENLWDCLVIIIKRVVFLVGAYSNMSTFSLYIFDILFFRNLPFNLQVKKS